MLKKLLGGAEETNLILFLAAAPEPEWLAAGSLIKLFLDSGRAGGRSAVLVRTGPTPPPLPLSEFTSVVDLTDPRGWRSEAAPTLSSDSLLDTLSKDTVLVLDNLTDLLVFWSAVAVASLLRTVRQRCGVVLTSLQSDCVEPLLEAEVTRLASTCLHLSCSDLQPGATLCRARHIKPGGRIVTSQELLQFSPAGQLTVLPFQQTKPDQVQQGEEEEVVNTLTTFNLGTRSREQEVKDNLVLPFYTESQGGGGVKIAGQDSRIYYEPDQGDDWDNEDPDDDLDF